MLLGEDLFRKVEGVVVPLTEGDMKVFYPILTTSFVPARGLVFADEDMRLGSEEMGRLEVAIIQHFERTSRLYPLRKRTLISLREVL